eukprot:228102_1
MTCATYSSVQRAIVIAGRSPEFALLDAHKKSMMMRPGLDSPVTHLAEGRSLCAATASGTLQTLGRDLRPMGDPIGLDGARVVDMDACGDVVVLCTSTTGKQSSLHELRAFDLRTRRELPSLPAFHLPEPGLVKFLPNLTSTFAFCSFSGSVSIMNLDNPPRTAFQLPLASDASHVTCMAVSQTGTSLAFGTDGGVRLWMAGDTRLNTNSVPLDPAPTIDEIGESDGSRIQTVPPPCKGALLSDLKHLVLDSARRYQPPCDVNQFDVLSWFQGIGFAPAPSANFMPNHLPSLVRFSAPIKSKKRVTRALLRNVSIDEEDHLTMEHLGYAPATVKSDHYGIDDFDFTHFNHTEHAGLENLLPNSNTCNAVLQALFFIRPFRNLMIRHRCSEDICLTCELGFLFHMLKHTPPTKPAEARNFLRVLKAIPEARMLSLLDSDNPTEDSLLAVRIQDMLVFILTKVGKESARTEDFHHLGDEYAELFPSLASAMADKTVDTAGASTLSATTSADLFECSFHVADTCRVCDHSHERTDDVVHLDLTFPEHTAAGVARRVPTFEETLGSAIRSKEHLRLWCDQCNAYERTERLKTLESLPEILFIHCKISKSEKYEPWRDQETSGPWLKHKFWVDFDDESKVPSVRTENDSGGSSEDSAEFSLMAVISHITDTSSLEADSVTRHLGEHLVAHVRVKDRFSGDSVWFLFNDFSVRHSSAAEAVNLYHAWKMPSILLYRRARAPNAPGDDPVAEADRSGESTPDSRSVNMGIFLKTPVNKSPPRRQSFVPLSSTETMHSSIVAMDCEFVLAEDELTETTEQGVRVIVRPRRLMLGRVTAIRGSPSSGDAGMNLYGQPLMDDYILQSEPVLDYLTAFSGIHPGDMDPATSEYHLVSQKTAYLKLRTLLDMGVTFVGHDLRKDFKLINLYVPDSQVIDTVELFRLSNKRRMSLKWLAAYFLGARIQLQQHDSAEDARAALQLYAYWETMKDSGTVRKTLESMYRAGK